MYAICPWRAECWIITSKYSLLSLTLIWLICGWSDLLAKALQYTLFPSMGLSCVFVVWHWLFKHWPGAASHTFCQSQAGRCATAVGKGHVVCSMCAKPNLFTVQGSEGTLAISSLHSPKNIKSWGKKNAIISLSFISIIMGIYTVHKRIRTGTGTEQIKSNCQIRMIRLVYIQTFINS